MSEPTNTPAPPTGKAQRNVLVFLCACVGFGLALLAIVGLPLENEGGVALAYLAVFAVAAASITLIFRAFVKRR